MSFASCRGEAFGQEIYGFSDRLLPECFALTQKFIRSSGKSDIEFIN